MTTLRDRPGGSGLGEGLPRDHAPGRAAQLVQFLGYLAPAVLVFALLEMAASLAFRDTGSAVTGGTLFVYGCALLVARDRARRGHPVGALATVCSGFLVETLVVAVVQPTLMLALIFAPLLAVGIALPYADERSLRALFVAAWVVAVAAAVVGEVGPTGTALPGWFESALRLASLSTAVAVVLLLLWQFRRRLFSALAGAREAEEKASYDATHDALTGLPNGVLFSERLGRALVRARSEPGYLFAVLFLDLDRFKNVNDSLGHDSGDRLLAEVARRFEALVYPADTVARLGGDEFTVLLDGIRGPEDAARVAERLEEVLVEPFVVGGYRLYVTASIGVVPSPGGYREPEEMLRDADTAMYRAKERGKGRYEIFSAEMREEVVRRLALETGLRQALEREEFVVHYQPIVSLASGTVWGFEALVRWDHPELGMRPPSEFVPVAEETGLIIPLGLFVLRRACLEAGRWLRGLPDHRPLQVSVNFSATQLSEANLADQFEATLREAGLRGYRLHLEITESAIMRDAERAADTLDALRKLGVGISVDDFGTGYASLSLLHHFAVDTLKVDHSFVQDLGQSPENAQIVRSIITLAHELGMDVVAEGVDAPGQLEILRSMGCDYAQGHLFSEPVPAPEAEAIILSRPHW